MYSNKNNPAILPVCKHVQICSRQNDNEVKNVAKFEDIRSCHENQIRDNSSKQASLSVLDANEKSFVCNYTCVINKTNSMRKIYVCILCIVLLRFFPSNCILQDIALCKFAHRKLETKINLGKHNS